MFSNRRRLLEEYPDAQYEVANPNSPTLSRSPPPQMSEGDSLNISPYSSRSPSPKRTIWEQPNSPIPYEEFEESEEDEKRPECVEDEHWQRFVKVH